MPASLVLPLTRRVLQDDQKYVINHDLIDSRVNSDGDWAGSLPSSVSFFAYINGHQLFSDIICSKQKLFSDVMKI